MSQTPYGLMPNSGMRSASTRPTSSPEHRSSDGERHSTYGSTVVNDPYMLSSNPSSSLIGAMGESSAGHYSRISPYPNNSVNWNAEPSIMSVGSETSYPGVAGPSGFLPSLPAYDDLNAARHASPESIDLSSPSYYQLSHEYMQTNRSHYRPTSQGSSPGSQSPYTVGSQEGELIRLRNQVQELQQALMEERNRNGTTPAVSNATLMSFREKWLRRTEAREKYFCSLNRAGNSLCAWHDSRRERRQYAPRNAPPGYLNCGCTYEEALFEESLSRHGVGSYLPGESVRMDPELRRPLLKLLKQRYGYKDGDFDYDPVTLQWHPGQDPASWERKAHAGKAKRSEHADRH